MRIARIAVSFIIDLVTALEGMVAACMAAMVAVVTEGMVAACIAAVMVMADMVVACIVAMAMAVMDVAVIAKSLCPAIIENKGFISLCLFGERVF